MKLILEKKPKKPTMIHGSPNFGLVSTITIKFLLDHLDTEEIGSIESEHLTPLTAIHKGKLVKPISLFYNSKYNLLLVQSLSEAAGFEWELAETLVDLAKTVDAKEVITLESTPGHEEKTSLFYYSQKNKVKGIEPIKESLIMGTTAAFLLKGKELNSTCIFAEAHSQLPDSEAAAKVIETLNSHLGLQVDTKPLLEQARKFELSLRNYMQKMKKPVMQKMPDDDKKETTNYFG
jgi:predicted ATP-grasp superfamily ATP-dependent carboligase